MNMTGPVNELKQRFESAGIDNAKRTAEELLAHVLGCKPLDIYLRSDLLAEDILKAAELLAVHIEQGEPLQYVIGHVDFMGLEIRCDPRALIPRPETELLVEELLSSGIWNRQSPVVADIGTGTGCIALALARQHPSVCLTAVDHSTHTLALARENARFHGMEDQIIWKQGHLLDGFEAGSLDAVIANLPYIATDDWRKLSPSVRNFEPQSALDSGPSGMELIEELAHQARSILVSGGMLFLEHGFDQGDAVRSCLEETGYRDIRIKQDLAGLDRLAVAVNP